MTNNLKILTILSIFVLILTGYFYFSSSFTKNQIITNNNDEEKKDGKDTNINNEDSNNNEEKDNEEKNLKLSILGIVIFIILIIIIAVIIFIIADKFEFNEKSKEDFKKENFCPFFFLIKIPKIIEEYNKCNNKNIKEYNKNKKFSDINDCKEDADSFFDILAKFIFFDEKNNSYDNYNYFFDYDKNNKIEIDLNSENEKKFISGYSYLMIDFPKILAEINDFALYSENLSDDEILENLKEEEKNDALQKIKNFEKEKEEIFKKYNSNRVLFNSYLYSYLLLYLFETFESKKNNIEIEICLPDTGICNYNQIKNNQVNYNYMYEILKNLVHDHDKFSYEESYNEEYDCKKLTIKPKN